jgi:hypothetical protein
MAVLLVAEVAVAAPRRVEVDGDRVLLADVVPRIGADLGGLDLGPAPAPGQSRRLQRQELVDRLRQAMVSSNGLRLRSVILVRPAQRLSEQELQQMVREATHQHLAGAGRVGAVRVRGGMLLPRGEVRATVAPVSAWRHGFQPVRVELSAGSSAPRRLVASVEVSLPRASHEPLIERGAEVVVVARLPGVLVRTTGIAQSGGPRGARIAVLPSNSRRVVRARVVDAGTVEVDP